LASLALAGGERVRSIFGLGGAAPASKVPKKVG